MTDFTNDFSLPLLHMAELVAACPTFRAIVGATTSAEAMEHIHVPYAEDVLIDDPDNPGQLILKHPLPRCVIPNFAELRKRRDGTDWGNLSGGIFVSFEFLPDPATPLADPEDPESGADPNLEQALFNQQLGAIVQEIEAREHRDKGAGEALFTDPAHTFLNIKDWDIVQLPQRCIPQEEQGAQFYFCDLVFNFTGGGR